MPEDKTPDPAPESAAHPGTPALDLAVGGAVLVEIEGLRRSFKARCLGWDKGRFVLVTFPSRPEIRDHLYQDRGLILRYLHPDGALHGFHSTVDAVLYKPERLLFARYPEKIETLSLRKEDRVDCFVRGSLLGQDGVRRPGMILNVSRGGCRFILGQPEPAAPLAVGESLTLTTRFFGCRLDLDLPVSVRAMRQESGRLVLGLLFSEIPQEAAEDIETYIQDIKTTLGLPGEA